MKSSIFLLFLAINYFVFSQENKDTSKYNKLSVDFGIGVSHIFSSVTKAAENDKLNLVTFNLGARYMFNNISGLKVDAGFNQFNTTFSNVDFKSTYLRGSAQYVMNLAGLHYFNTFSDKLGLLGHAGAGLGILNNDTFNLITGNDKVINIIFGLTPQVKINERVSIYGDLSFVKNYLQSHNFDYITSKQNRSDNSLYSEITLGLTYRFGQNATHYDWVALTPKKDNVEDLSNIENKVKVLEEQVKDDDKDGVINAYDEEPNTPPGSKVDVKGVHFIPEVAKVDTLNNVGKEISAVKQNELNKEIAKVKTRENIKKNLSEGVDIQSLDGLDGLFFTVQIGAYDRYMKVDSYKKLKNVYVVNLPDGKVRFCTGLFPSDKDAYQTLYHARQLGFTDAFLTAYYKGERIPIYKAREILKKEGEGVIEPEALKK